MSEELAELIKAAKNTPMSSSEYEEQRVSFAYGNTHFENEQITRKMVREASEDLKNHGHS